MEDDEAQLMAAELLDSTTMPQFGDSILADGKTVRAPLPTASRAYMQADGLLTPASARADSFMVVMPNSAAKYVG